MQCRQAGIEPSHTGPAARRRARSGCRSILLGFGVAMLLAACGSTASSQSTTTTTTSAAPTTTSSSMSSTSSPLTSMAPKNLVASAADKAALIAAFVADKKIPASDIVGTTQGSVYLADIPSTGTSWALATFAPSATASQSTLVGLQDGGSMGIFTKPAGGSWTMVGLGSFPFCPSQTQIPVAVQQLWGLSDPQGC